MAGDRSRVNHIPFFGASTRKLVGKYYTATAGCEYPGEWIIAFTNITVEEWEQSQEECMEKMARGDTDKTYRETGEGGAGGGLPQQMAIEGLGCSSDLLLDVLKNPDLYILDDEPFTELYICDVPEVELNGIIGSGELGSRCESIPV